MPLAAVPTERHEARAEQAAPVIRPRATDRETRVARDGDAYVVSVRAAERIAALVDPGDWEARTQLMEQFRRMGVTSALEKAGARAGDLVRIGKLELEWD